MNSLNFIGSPIGRLRVEFSDIGLVSLSLVREEVEEKFSGLYDRDCEDRLSAVKTYINDYFYGRDPGRRDIDLDMTGIPPFHKLAYEELMKVGFGEVISYGELAEKAGSPGGGRAVGNAMNRNPFLIVVPCHRVVASGKGERYSLGGFGAGLSTKRLLLRLEGHSGDIIGL
jgi:methylated-DNA-[protein]-cysteine S-methyltransferase